MAYKLDKTAFAILTHAQAAERHVDVENLLSYEERLARCTYLTKVAYGYANQPMPRMDKTIFNIRQHEA